MSNYLHNGKPVSNVLLSKHPAPFQPPEAAFEDYNHLLALVNMDITEDNIKNVMAKMQGVTGPGGVNSIMWQDWLLHYGNTRSRLCKSVASTA
eukprot:6375794-Ditylum_brightwellii.AAC.1